MDWVNIIIGLLIGGGAGLAILWRKAKTIKDLFLDIERLIGDGKSMVKDWKEANEDGILSPEEVKELLEDVDDMVKRLEVIVDDYERLRKGV